MENNKKQRKKISSAVVLRYFKEYFLVLLGCFCVAFGDALFITPCNIVCGGVASIGIILNHYLQPLWGFDVNSLVSAIVQVVLLLIGWIILGKDFGFKTIFAGLAFTGFYALLLGINIGQLVGLGEVYAVANSGNVSDLGVLSLMGIAGGAFQGIGVALSYLGGGSTGGLDIISRIIAKFTAMKEDISAFIMDAVLVTIGIIVFRSIMLGIIGIMTAFICAAAIQMLYITLSSYVVVDIISDKYEEIQDFVHTKMQNNGHGSTIIMAQGGYSGMDKKMLRVVIYHNEETKFRSIIAEIDPKAFVVFTQAKSIHGDGFQPLPQPVKFKKVTKLPKEKGVENNEDK